MLLIGSSARNSGKTAFACELLRRFAPSQPITGVKITVIRRGGGPCPRGVSGCNVCSSLDGSHDISEETDRDGRKDTSRLLRAGARRVFWLRVLESHMSEGLDALCRVIDPDVPVICESNSIRRAVEPGLFLMVRDTHTATFKATARAVADLADRTVKSDGASFEFDFDAVHLRNGRWCLREDATAIVLAGGDSVRMGHDKGMLDVDGRSMIEHVCDQLRGHFEQIVVSANDPEKYAFLELDVVTDREPGMGPMMGLASSLAAVSRELALAVACDIPEINLSLAHRMLNLADDYDAVVPRVRLAGAEGETRLEPLFAIYRKSMADRMFNLLGQGERRARSPFEVSRVRYVDVDASESPPNLNTEKDYRDYASRNRAGI